MSDKTSGGLGVACSTLLGRMRLLEKDHAPDGWPAVQMRDVSALCAEIEALREAIAGILIYATRRRDFPVPKLGRKLWKEQMQTAYEKAEKLILQPNAQAHATQGRTDGDSK